MNQADKYQKKLEKAEQKIRILEQMIENHTRELYTANITLQLQNKELEQFTFIASHDLQEPLRTVKSFTELLANNYSQHFDEVGKNSMHFISEATERMSNLITSLLDYSRLGQKKDLKIVDCNEILKNVLADVNNMITKSNAKITYERLPILSAYESELCQLFMNLISNGIKFAKSGVAPEINISAIQQHDKWQFSVKDNGIGIEPQHHERIFKIFQRSHNRDEFEGTGIGLALCKKIIELHKGDLWLESTPNHGSTFFFTIPFKKY